MRVRAGDAVLKDHHENGPANAQYICPQIQNELLDAACKLIKGSVIADVIKSKFWCLLADETQDRNKRELLVIVLRYIGVESGVLFVSHPSC